MNQISTKKVAHEPTRPFPSLESNAAEKPAYLFEIFQNTCDTKKSIVMIALDPPSLYDTHKC